MTWHDWVTALLVGLLGLTALAFLITFIPSCVYVHHDVTVIAIDNTTTAEVGYDRAASLNR